MKILLSNLLLLFTVLVNSIDLIGQNTISFERSESYTVEAHYDTLISDVSQIINIHEYKEISTELSDTTNIASIRVKLGSTSDASDLQINTYNFSGESLSSQLWFSRRNNILQIGLGDLINIEQCYIRIEALDASGAVLGFYNGILY